ncbi:sporulation protein YqfD [Phosphitispora sp. TUW77]|uniref:sporulation protein YqfD n=1 Tax=Phosphitispora sp. TUW77 TaxID=3152361 RepID=UPI003AB5B183
MLARLWSFITGYVLLVVEGKNFEKLINMAVSRGIYLWDVKWTDSGKASVKLRLNGIRALRHIGRRTGCRFKIVGRGGLPFRIAGMKKRKVLLSGAVMSVLAIYLLTSFVWFVEVKGNVNIPRERLLKTAEEAGLSMGTLKKGLDKDSVEKYLRNEIPEVSWVGIRVTGTKAVIEIAEKVIIPPADNSPANVVALKDGLIREILVLRGRPAVIEGDMVKKNDILITGVIAPEPEQDEENDSKSDNEKVLPVELVRARGIVRASVWYEGYGECRLVDTGVRRTGKKVQTLSIRAFNKEFVIKGPKSILFQSYVTDTNVKRIYEWRNLSIPVELITMNYYEVESYRDIIGITQAKKIARERALASVTAKLPFNARILKEVSEEIPARGSNVVRVKYVLETVEDIGRIQPLKKNSSS